MNSSELKQAIHENPYDEDNWLTLSDYLRNSEDIRGELISLELSGGSDRINEIYEKNIPIWCGEELHTMITESTEDEDSELKIEWKYGYIWSVRLHSYYDYSGPNMVELLEAIIQSPAGEFLTELKVGILDAEENDYSDVVELMKKHSLPSLKHLHLGDFEYPDDNEISWNMVNDVSPVWKAAPNLEKLRLTGAEISLGTISHRHLRSLSLETGGLPAEAIHSVMAADLPELTDLEMWFGDEGYGAEGDITMIKPLLAGGLFPKLNSLGLMNSEFQDEIVEALATAPVVKNLRALDISMGTMVDKGAQFLIDSYDHFKHLESINLSDNFVSQELCSKLSGLYGSIIDLSNQSDDLDYIYVSVSE